MGREWGKMAWPHWVLPWCPPPAPNQLAATAPALSLAQGLEGSFLPLDDTSQTSGRRSQPCSFPPGTS